MVERRYRGPAEPLSRTTKREAAGGGGACWPCSRVSWMTCRQTHKHACNVSQELHTPNQHEHTNTGMHVDPQKTYTHTGAYSTARPPSNKGAGKHFTMGTHPYPHRDAYSYAHMHARAPILALPHTCISTHKSLHHHTHAHAHTN